MLGQGFFASSLVVVAASFAVACSSDTTGELTAKLDGRTFVSTDVQGYELVAGTTIRLQFKGELSAHAGCNSHSGPYTIKGDVLQVPGLGSTEIGCDMARTLQDAWLSDILTSSPRLALDDPTLTMTKNDVVITLVDREVASPDQPLVGTQWKGDGIGDNGLVMFGPGADQVRVSFDAGGGVEVFTACETGTGQYSTSGNAITFKDLTYDGVACTQATLQSISNSVRSILDGARMTYKIEEKVLRITRDDGRLLMFRAPE